MKIRFRRVVVMVCFTASLFATVHSAFAKLVDGVNSPNYAVRAPTRLLQGIVNFSFGWTALILDPTHAAQQPDKKFVDGVFDGMGNVITYTWLGAWDVATFWVPAQMGQDMSGVKHNVFNL